MTTPPEIWVPAFSYLKDKPLTVEIVFASFEEHRKPGQVWCRLCETYVPLMQREKHAAAHERERKGFGKVTTVRAPRVEVRQPQPRPSAVERPRKEVTKMAKDKNTTKRPALSDAKEKALVASVEKTFGSRSKEFRAGAVTYGRKLLKLASGLRSSKPPVPPALMDKDREKTRETCADVARAVGLDPEKLGLVRTPADDLKDEAVKAKEKAAPKRSRAKATTGAKA